MASLKEMFAAKAGDAAPLLHGSDLGKKESSVVIKVKELREAPESFNSIAIIDFVEPVHEKEAWAVNKTNMRAIAEKFGFEDDADIAFMNSKLTGKKLTLSKVMVNNPQTKKMGPSLFIS